MATGDLITLARAQLNPALASTDATLLATLISAASKQIQNWLRRDIVSTTYTDKLLDGEGYQTLFIPQYPITNIAQVDFIDTDGTINSVMPNGADFTKYFFIGDAGEIDFIQNNPGSYSSFPSGFKNIKITFTAGFSTVPEDIQEACTEVIVFMQNQGSANTAVSSEKLGDWGINFFDQNKSGGGSTKSKTAFEILSAYRDMGY